MERKGEESVVSPRSAMSTPTRTRGTFMCLVAGVLVGILMARPSEQPAGLSPVARPALVFADLNTVRWRQVWYHWPTRRPSAASRWGVAETWSAATISRTESQWARQPRRYGLRHPGPSARSVRDRRREHRHEQLRPFRGYGPADGRLDERGPLRQRPHKANMLESTYGHIGIGACATGDGMVVVAEFFPGK